MSRIRAAMSIRAWLLLFVLFASPDLHADDVLYFPPINLPEFKGAPPGTCDVPGVTGETLLEVATRAVAANNAVTGSQCSGQCRNPATLYGINESNSTFTMQSDCGGGLYTYTVISTPSPEQDPCSVLEGNPCNPVSGNKIQQENDYSSTYLSFTRTFNNFVYSRNSRSSFGPKWVHNYSESLDYVDCQGCVFAFVPKVYLWRMNGRQTVFDLRNSDGVWRSWSDRTVTLTELYDDSGVQTGWQYDFGENSFDRFNMKGQLIARIDASGLETTLLYDLTSANGGDGNALTLDRVVGPFGAFLQFTHDSQYRITAMTDPAGFVYTYTYDANSNLTSVTYPDDTPGTNADNPKRIYHYGTGFLLNYLTGITDENGVRFATWSYVNNRGVVTSSEHANGVEKLTFQYDSDSKTTTVTDANGAIRVYQWASVNKGSMPTGVSGDICDSCGFPYAQIGYDSYGFPNFMQDFRGTVTQLQNDVRGRPLTRTEAPGTPLQREILTEWHPTYRLPMKVTQPGRETIYTYDTAGRVLSVKESTP